MVIKRAQEMVQRDNFRLCNQKMMLTYKTHLDKTEFEEYCKTDPKIGRYYETMKFFRMAHEYGKREDDELKYEHTHVVVDWGRAVDVRRSDFFNVDIDGMIIQASINPLTTLKHWDNGVRYLGKEDPANADLLDYKRETKTKPTLDELRGMKLEDAYIACGCNPMHYAPLRKILDDVEEVPHDPFKFNAEYFTWTRSIMKLVNEKINDENGDNRRIHWYYSNDCGPEGDGGCMGKTTFGLWINHNYPTWQYITCSGKKGDLARKIQNRRDKRGWDKRTSGIHGLIIDLPRAREHHKEFYSFLEEMGNRCLSADKYDSDDIMLRHNIHIVVLANFPPSIYRRADGVRGGMERSLSIDRFRIYKIIDETMCIQLNTRIFSLCQAKLIKNEMELQGFDNSNITVEDDDGEKTDLDEPIDSIEMQEAMF